MQMTVREFIGAIQKATMYIDPTNNVTVDLLRQVMTKVSEEELTAAFNAVNESNKAKLIEGTEDLSAKVKRLGDTAQHQGSVVEAAYRKTFNHSTHALGPMWFELAVEELIGAGSLGYKEQVEKLQIALDDKTRSYNDLVNVNQQQGVKIADLQEQLGASRGAYNTLQQELNDAQELLRKKNNTEKLLQDLNSLFAENGGILRLVSTEPFTVGDHVTHRDGDGRTAYCVSHIRTVEKHGRQFKFQGHPNWLSADEYVKVGDGAKSIVFKPGDCVTSKASGGRILTVNDVNLRSKEMRFVEVFGWHAMSEFRKV